MYSSQWNRKTLNVHARTATTDWESFEYFRWLPLEKEWCVTNVTHSLATKKRGQNALHTFQIAPSLRIATTTTKCAQRRTFHKRKTRKLICINQFYKVFANRPNSVWARNGSRACRTCTRYITKHLIHICFCVSAVETMLVTLVENKIASHSRQLRFFPLAICCSIGIANIFCPAKSCNISVLAQSLLASFTSLCMRAYVMCMAEKTHTNAEKAHPQTTRTERTVREKPDTGENAPLEMWSVRMHSVRNQKYFPLAETTPSVRHFLLSVDCRSLLYGLASVACCRSETANRANPGCLRIFRGKWSAVVCGEDVARELWKICCWNGNNFWPNYLLNLPLKCRNYSRYSWINPVIYALL